MFLLLLLQGKEAMHNIWGPQTPEPEQDMLDGTPGSINVSSILTGKLVAKVSAVAKPRTFRERKVSDALTGACTALCRLLCALAVVTWPPCFHHHPHEAQISSSCFSMSTYDVTLHVMHHATKRLYACRSGTEPGSPLRLQM